MTSIIFMGTPDFSAPILTSLIKDYNVIAVVTQPDRKVGRKQTLTTSPVKAVAVAHQIPVYQPEKLSGSEELTELINLHADLIVTAAYGQFLPTSFLESVNLAAINVHASLLPKYRGGAPIQYALLNQDLKTGVTIIYMVKKMDAGKMLAQAELPIEPSDDAGTLFEKLSIVGRDLLLETLPKIIVGTQKEVEQIESEVVFSPTISAAEEVLDFSKDAAALNGKIRALSPHPGAYSFVNGQRFKIWQATPLDEKTNQAPGVIVRKTKHELVLACGGETTLSLLVIQPAGKGKQKISDFLNGTGHALKEGQQFIDVNEPAE